MTLSAYPRSRSVLIIGIVCLLASFAGAILVAAHKDNNLPTASPQASAASFDSPAGNAVALDSLLGLRDPFRVVGIPDWWPTGSDKNTRLVFVARNLQLNPGELPSAVLVRFTTNTQTFDVGAEDVRSIPNSEFTQVVVRIPNNLTAGTCTVLIRAHTLFSNSGTIRIAP